MLFSPPPPILLSLNSETRVLGEHEKGVCQHTGFLQLSLHTRRSEPDAVAQNQLGTCPAAPVTGPHTTAQNQHLGAFPTAQGTRAARERNNAAPISTFVPRETYPQCQPRLQVQTGKAVESRHKASQHPNCGGRQCSHRTQSSSAQPPASMLTDAQRFLSTPGQVWTPPAATAPSPPCPPTCTAPTLPVPALPPALPLPRPACTAPCPPTLPSCYVHPRTRLQELQAGSPLSYSPSLEQCLTHRGHNKHKYVTFRILGTNQRKTKPESPHNPRSKR